VVKKNSYQGTADYADEQDTADERKPHQRRTEGSQSAYIRVHLWFKNSCPGTADYADEQDTADERKPHQRRTEGSQSAYICGLKTVVQEPQITRMKQMAQMKKNHISVEPKVRNLCTSVFICGKKTVVTGGSSA
jgi:hypothetical protein